MLKILIIGAVIGFIAAIIKVVSDSQKTTYTPPVSSSNQLTEEEKDAYVKARIEKLYAEVAKEQQVEASKQSPFEKGFGIKKYNGELFEFTDEELTFANTVLEALHENKIFLPLNIDLKAGGTLNFRVGPYQIGRIQLRENRRMQILTEDTVEWIENISPEKALYNISKWIDYAKNLNV